MLGGNKIFVTWTEKGRRQYKAYDDINQSERALNKLVADGISDAYSFISRPVVVTWSINGVDDRRVLPNIDVANELRSYLEKRGVADVVVTEE